MMLEKTFFFRDLTSLIEILDFITMTASRDICSQRDRFTNEVIYIFALIALFPLIFRGKHFLDFLAHNLILTLVYRTM